MKHDWTSSKSKQFAGHWAPPWPRSHQNSSSGHAADAGDGEVSLPFEGDERLAVILSKAFLLAEDVKISDPTILSQIGR